MAEIKSISYKKLKRECSADFFQFRDTSEQKPLESIIGQERAVKAMDFGLKTNIRGYNIYMSGTTGTGKTSFAQSYIQKIAQDKPRPDDWCYVYNFDKPNKPMALNMPAGLGKVFKDDMEEFIKVIQSEISRAFESEDYEKEKTAIIKEYQDKRSELFDRLSEDAKKKGFKVKTTSSGIYFLPLVDGKTLNEEEYVELDDFTKQEIDEKTSIVQMETMDIIRKIKDIEKEAEKKVDDWEGKIALFAVGMQINDIKEKYRDYESINKYLDRVQENILKNLDDFRTEEYSEEQQMVLPWIKSAMSSPAEKYSVNLIVDNSELTGAPVVIDYNPTYYNLVGRLEYENEFGSMSTDYTLIKGGLFHHANGGYLILQAKDVLRNVQSWEVLKRVLRTKKITIENLREQIPLVNVSTLKPEPIQSDIKVVLVGSEYLYQFLYEYDEEFKKLFKIKVDFDDEMDWKEQNIKKLAGFVSSFCEREKTRHFDGTGMAAIIEYGSRLVENQNKITTRFNDIVEILCEANTWAEMDNAKIISRKHVEKAIREKIYRSNKHDKKLLELIKEGTIMIDTDGEVTGQINGLSIIDVSDYEFGKPSRITATTYIGESGIVNIEREIKLSGTSHTKGVLILSGYIGQKYAQEIPLSLSASLCFEQLYSEIDGDSASSAELYAILSSLSELPIKQYIAVTGSVNQKGEIQPVGGVTSKIEGFFELCKERGLTGKQGVIMPHQNINNLVLKDEVINEVKNGNFHIYPVKNIDEGIEILTGVKAGRVGKDGTYLKGTVNKKVYDKLRKFAFNVYDMEKKDKKDRLFQP